MLPAVQCAADSTVDNLLKRTYKNKTPLTMKRYLIVLSFIVFHLSTAFAQQSTTVVHPWQGKRAISATPSPTRATKPPRKNTGRCSTSGSPYSPMSMPSAADSGTTFPARRPNCSATTDRMSMPYLSFAVPTTITMVCHWVSGGTSAMHRWSTATANPRRWLSAVSAHHRWMPTPTAGAST